MYADIVKRFGIYLNPNERVAVRINSPYWLPEGPDWVFLTPEVNMTMASIRKLAGEKGLVPDPEAIRWGTLPVRE
ncbi:MAG: hypothetical protein HYX99_02580 [Chloroflexi bacterium]|nr:hypothetical protein [Chloroflexota bacterium]